MILKALRVCPSIKVEIAADEIIQIAQRHKASNVRVFGSCGRGTDTEDSDVDLIVDFDETASTYDVAELVSDLEELLGSGVEVLSSRIEVAQRFLVDAEHL